MQRPSKVLTSSTPQNYFNHALTSLTFEQMLQFGVIFNVKYYYCKEFAIQFAIVGASVRTRFAQVQYPKAGASPRSSRLDSLFKENSIY